MKTTSRCPPCKCGLGSTVSACLFGSICINEADVPAGCNMHPPLSCPSSYLIFLHFLLYINFEFLAFCFAFYNILTISYGAFCIFIKLVSFNAVFELWMYGISTWEWVSTHAYLYVCLCVFVCLFVYLCVFVWEVLGVVVRSSIQALPLVLDGGSGGCWTLRCNHYRPISACYYIRSLFRAIWNHFWPSQIISKSLLRRKYFFFLIITKLMSKNMIHEYWC